jgi:hypothetical protein
MSRTTAKQTLSITVSLQAVGATTVLIACDCTGCSINLNN